MPLGWQLQAISPGAPSALLQLLPLLALAAGHVTDPQGDCVASPMASTTLLSIASSLQRVALPDHPEHVEASPPHTGLLGLSIGTSDGASSSGTIKGHSTNLLARNKEVPASWFGGFAKDESTYDADGVGDHPDYPEREAAGVGEDGKTVNKAAQKNPVYMSEEGLPEDWFEESKSAGPSGAWRTQFPAVEAFNKDGMRTVPWLPRGSRGARLQSHRPQRATSIARAFDFTRKKDANWFDDSIEEYDEYGRNRPPSARSDRYYWDWQRKNWSVPFGCEKPGCVASAMLKTFDPKALQHEKCEISVGVHATDFDDEYSRENVEFIMVNGVRISTSCNPMARGCNKSVSAKNRGLHSCVSDFPLDNLLRSGTNLNITSKISEMVDECPVDNKLLSGEARVVCWVRPWPTAAARPPPVPAKSGSGNCSTPLQCSEHGCTAKVSAPVCRTRPWREGEKCTMTMRIWQTDFDGDHGSKEVVEWVKVNGEEIAKDLNPGRNPCKEVFEGKAPTNASLAKRNSGTPTVINPLSLDAQSRGLLAPIPGDMQNVLSCRRRVAAQLQGSSAMKELEMQRSRTPRNINHLRAAPDNMKEIITAKDVTKAVGTLGHVLVEAKISKRVDECAKDGFLLNAEVSVECK